MVSLSDYGREYRGGIYVAPGRASKRVLALARGDAVAHQSDLLQCPGLRGARHKARLRSETLPSGGYGHGSGSSSPSRACARGGRGMGIGG